MGQTNHVEMLRSSLASLREDRERIDLMIKDLESALRRAETLSGYQRELQLDSVPEHPGITLLEAVKRCCMEMVDGISKQRVMSAIRAKYPGIDIVPSSVSAALINLSKGEAPMLKLALEGQGRTPAFYSTESEREIVLTPEEIDVLMDPHATHGTGGWQSLWLALQKQFDKETGKLVLSPALRARVYSYFQSYGVGGWQAKVKRLFRRELPHLVMA